jgi:hypothetical protein
MLFPTPIGEKTKKRRIIKANLRVIPYNTEEPVAKEEI